MAPKPIASGTFLGTHQFVFLGISYTLEKPSPDHEVYLMLQRPDRPQALTGDQLAAMSSPDATQVKRMLMAGIGKRFRDDKGMPIPLNAWLESLTVEDLVLAIAPTSPGRPPQILQRATLIVTLRDESNFLTGRPLHEWLRLKQCSARFTIDAPDASLLDPLIDAAWEAFFQRTAPQLMRRLSVATFRQMDHRLDTGAPLETEDLDLFRQALRWNEPPPPPEPMREAHELDGMRGEAMVEAAQPGDDDYEFPDVLEELLFEVQKIAEVPLDEEVPDPELIADLEETFPKLPNASTLPRRFRKLAEAAEVIVRNARQFELLDEDEMKTVQKALRPFEEHRVARRAKIVGNAFQLVKGIASGAMDPSKGPVLGIISGVMGAIKSNGMDQEPNGKMQQLLQVAGSIQQRVGQGGAVVDGAMQGELQGLLKGLARDKMGRGEGGGLLDKLGPVTEAIGGDGPPRPQILGQLKEKVEEKKTELLEKVEAVQGEAFDQVEEQLEAGFEGFEAQLEAVQPKVVPVPAEQSPEAEAGNAETPPRKQRRRPPPPDPIREVPHKEEKAIEMDFSDLTEAVPDPSEPAPPVETEPDPEPGTEPESEPTAVEEAKEMLKAITNGSNPVQVLGGLLRRKKSQVQEKITAAGGEALATQLKDYVPDLADEEDGPAENEPEEEAPLDFYEDDEEPEYDDED